jgi:hypothetical protein
MLLNFCTKCQSEIFPDVMRDTWRQEIGELPESVLIDFCECEEPVVGDPPLYPKIDYRDLFQAIKEVGEELNV